MVPSEKQTALWVVGDGEVAGVGRHVLDALSAGIPGWRVRVLAPAGPLRQHLPADVVVDVGFGPQVGLKQSVEQVRRAVRYSRASIVHSHLAWADLVSALAGLSIRVRNERGGTTKRSVRGQSRGFPPLVSTEHGITADPMTYEARHATAMITAAAHTWRMRRLAALICVSEATAAAVVRRWRPPDRLPISVIYNGIARRSGEAAEDFESARIGTIHPPTVGYLGRFAPEKRVDLSIDAFALLHQRIPAARLSLAGAGPQEGLLRAQVDRLNLSEQVSFPGWVSGAEWMSTVDVLCLPSAWENCSYALLQALAAGVGVVAAPVGGNLELLPPTAMVDPLRKSRFAEAIRSQITGQVTRPALPPFIPTVPQMCSEIAAVYRSVSGL